jgi:fibronectin-binding autotransporter adhesin
MILLYNTTTIKSTRRGEKYEWCFKGEFMKHNESPIHNVVVIRKCGKPSLRIALLLTLLLSRTEARADTVYWTGLVGDGFWGTAGNWSSLTTPTVNDDVINNTGNTITVGSLSAGMHSLTSNGDLTLTGAQLYFYNDSIQMAPGTTLALDSNSSVSHYLAFGSPATTLSGFTLNYTSSGSLYNTAQFDGGPGGTVLNSTMIVTGKNASLSTSDLAFSNATTLSSSLGGDWKIGNAVYGNVTSITNTGTIGAYGNLVNDSSTMYIYAQYLNNTGIIEANASADIGAGGYAQTYLSLAGYDALRELSLGTIRATGNHAYLTLSTSTSVGDALPTAQLATVSAQNGGHLTLSGVIDNRGTTFTPSNYRDAVSTVNLKDLTLRGGNFAGSQGGAIGRLQLDDVAVTGDIGTDSSENINLQINEGTTFAPNTRVRIGYDSDFSIANFTNPYTLSNITLISDSANVQAVGDLTLGADFAHQGRYTSFRAPSITNLSHTDLDDISLSADVIVNKGRISADGQHNGTSFIPISSANNYSGSTLTNAAGALLSAVNGGRMYLESENVKNSGTILIDANSTMLLAQNGPTDGTTLTQDAGLTTVNGRLQAENSAARFLLNGGTLKGSGVIEPELIQNGGVISPGNSPGTLTLTGSFTQNAGGTLLMEIASNTLYDQLVLSGASNTLEGVLELQFVGGYQPQVGDSFNLFRDGSGQPVMTAFSSIVLPSGYSGNFTAGGFMLSSVAAPEPSTLALLTFSVLGFIGSRRKIGNR